MRPDRWPVALPASRLALGLVALALLWLATRPYAGVIHDSKFYAVQAIAWADPARFAEDLFFAFGSQDGFSVFQRLYAPFVAWLGVPVAHALVLAAGHLLWLGAAWMLAAALLPGMALRLWSLAALMLLPRGYGYLATLGYGEPFVTPRLFAEAASVAALALALRGRLALPVVLLVGAALLHPLIAAPAIAVLVLLRLAAWPRLAAALVGAGVLLAALVPLLPAGLPERIGTMDAAWRTVVAMRSPFVLVAAWSWVDHARLVGQVLLAALVVLALDGPRRRLAVACLAVALGGLAVALLAGDIGELHIVIAGQPTRALWLLLVMTHLLLLPAVLRLRQEGLWTLPLARAVTILLAVAMLAAAVVPAASAAVPLPAALLLALCALHRARYAPGPAGALALRLGFGVGVVWFAFIGVVVALAIGQQVPEMLLPSYRLVPLAACGVALLLVATAPRAGGRGTVAGTALVALVALGAAAATHDQRRPWQRFLESDTPARTGLAAFIPPGRRVVWDGGAEFLWLNQQRPVFFACLQGAGVAFYRATAIEFAARAAQLPILTLEGTCFGALSPRTTPPGRADLEAACRALPALDHIVLADRIENLAVASWHIPAARDIPGSNRLVQPAGDVHRYDCAALRGGAATETRSP
jgi:hypothetical protein